MKRYEAVSSHQLPDRLPVIIRVDGKAFHTYTAELNNNDENLVNAMWLATIELCENIQGARLAYVQSDEISVLVNPWTSNDSSAWFDNNLQKIVSVAASIASATLTARSYDVFKRIKPAFFDARAFVLPKEEVVNYFIWRQQDAIRNSVQNLMRAHFSHKETQGKSRDVMKVELLKKGVNWDELPIHTQRGACAIRTMVPSKNEHVVSHRTQWVIHSTPPVFTQDREYVERRLVNHDEIAEIALQNAQDQMFHLLDDV